MSRLNTIRSGQGPVLVMLHGLFGSLDNFRSVSLHLERNFNVLRIDLPGHGISPKLPSLSIEAMAEAVVVELAEQQIRQCHLLGHSLGGKVAMSIAGSKSNTGIQSLCVVDIAPREYPPHHEIILDALTGIDLLALKSRRQADALLMDTITDAGIRAFLLKSLYRDADQNFAWRFDLAGLQRDYPLICKAPEIQQVVEQPTLFIKGGNSDYLQNRDETVIRELFANPSLKVIEGAGHWPHAEKPGLFTRICQEFVHGVHGAGGSAI